MIELIVGSKFYYEGKLYEVVEGGCSSGNCVFKNSNKCHKINCDSYERYDRTDVIFKEIKE